MIINFNAIKDQDLTIGDIQKMEKSIIHMQGTKQITSFSAQDSLSSPNLRNQESLDGGFQYPVVLDGGESP